MKLTDIDRVNHLVAQLEDIKSQIALAERADDAAFQLLVEAPGDAGLRMSQEGASTAHSRGIDVSPRFLAELKRLAVQELDTKRGSILAELAQLGVETND